MGRLPPEVRGSGVRKAVGVEGCAEESRARSVGTEILAKQKREVVAYCCWELDRRGQG